MLRRQARAWRQTTMPTAPAARGCRSAGWPRGSTWRPCPPCPGLPFLVKLKRCTSGRDLLIRSALPGTDRILISPCSPRWPSGWICACSTAGIAARRGLSSPRWMASSGTATGRVSARASNTATGCTARTRPAAASGATPAKLRLDPYGKAVEGPAPLARGLVLPPVRRARCHQHSRQCPLYAAQCRYQSVFLLGR